MCAGHAWVCIKLLYVMIPKVLPHSLLILDCQNATSVHMAAPAAAQSIRFLTTFHWDKPDCACPSPSTDMWSRVSKTRIATQSTWMAHPEKAHQTTRKQR